MYLLGSSGIASVVAFMIVQNDNNVVLAQQNIANLTTGGGTITPNIQGQQYPYSMSTSLGSQNWTGSISVFSPIIDAFKSKIHITLNDATTNAIKAVGGGSNSSAVAAFIRPERGFLVYHVFVLGPSNMIHRVIVDPGNGRVLFNQPMLLAEMMSMARPSMGMMRGPSTGMMDQGTGMMDQGTGMMGHRPPGMMMGGP
jgi:hypothetical protein